MTSQEYIKLAVRTECEPLNVLVNIGLGNVTVHFKSNELIQKLRLLHCAIGLCTEVGEFQENLTHNRDKINLYEEVGDLLWYCAIGFNTLDFNNELILSCKACEQTLEKARDNLVMDVGMLQGIIKRSLFYGKPLDESGILQLLVYIWNNCAMITDLEPIMEKNIAKLRARYPEKFTNEHALNRDLEKELEALK